MTRLKEWLNRLRYLRGRVPLDEDLDQEVRFHLETRATELEAEGLSRRDAVAAAQREFGSVLRAREDSRAAWQFRWLEDLVADVRYALRTFRRSPGFTLTTALSLALGIGATSTIFTALDAALWKPLPVADPQSLVRLSIARTNRDDTETVPAAFLAQLRQAGVFADVAARISDGLSFSYDDRAERIIGEAVSPNYFTFLGVEPLIGQGFTPEVRAGGWAPEAVLSHGFWTRRFGADPTVIGRTLYLNTHPFTIVGVSPPSFTGVVRGTNFELRIPLMPSGRTLPQIALIGAQANRTWQPLARLAPGTTMAQAGGAADAQFQMFLRSTTVPRFREAGYRQVRVTYGGDGYDYWLRSLRPTLYVLLVLAATVLVIACINVAGLLLARATARSRELAVRLSMGAGRLRLIRQMVAESVLLSLFGGVLALALANWTADLLAWFVPQGHVGIVLDTRLDARVLLFTLAISVSTALAFGLLPALHATRSDLAAALKADSARSGGARQGARARRALVMAQVAFSVVLLIATGIFVRTLANLRPDDYRTEPARVLLFTLKPQQEIYTPARKLAMASSLLRDLSQLAAVRSAALAEFGPFGSRDNEDTFQVEGRQPITAQTDWVTPGFFDTIGLPRIAGRDFTADDKPGTPWVLIVNRALARALFGDADPLGRRVQLRGDAQARAFEIVGVVADTQYYSPRQAPGPSAWFAYQGADDLYMPTLHVRTGSPDTASAIAAIRGAFDRVDKGFPVFNVKTLDARIDESLGRERMIANISAAFGLLALVLAAVGLYGILAYSVVRRRREIGIRIALGSGSRGIIAMIAREGFVLVGIGSAAGLVLAMIGSRLLSRYLVGVSPLDPSIVAACAMLMIAIAGLAVCVPALRACRVDPLIALRQD